MRKALRTGAAVICGVVHGDNCAGAGRELREAQEAMALQAAAVQQQLMVAALSCDAIPLYNHFVTAYQTEL